MIDDVLKAKLSTLNIPLEEFSALLIRLLDYGVISREESQVEAQLYDRYMICAELVEDYLSILNIRLLHDRQFCFVRVFPPSAQVPGLPDDDNSAFNQGMRYRPTQQEVSLILVLRVEYEKSLREGLLDDSGCVLVSFESIAFAMKNLLKRSLPEQSSERSTLFKRIRQLRLIQFNSDNDLNLDEGWMSIQPSITSFVTDEVLQSLHPQDDEQDQDTQQASTNALTQDQAEDQ
ncbi:DUF4194 domain-containing protein [Marinagarivorans algicola]|uniref:DUF4194 domain-containing protein n=1 Tax=Marinagarivorans algicola TaxID=1513270 RepID=UPI0006B42EA9|nr:DUF4194 domain-containing protein [Marinagarivorans algicola]